MKKRTRYVLLCAVTLLLAGAWVWRYVNLNAYYGALSGESRTVYKVGDTVPFGQDYLDANVQADGYSIRVDSFAIMDLDEFLEQAAIPPDQVYTNPDKVAVVHATLFNDHSEAEGIMLTEFDLHGIDNYANLDWELLASATPVLQGNNGIRLSPETEYSIVLPFALYQQYFGTDTWKNMDSYSWFLHLTAFPVEKDIQVQ